MPRYTKARADAAVAVSMSVAAALRALGMCPTGSDHKTLTKYIAAWEIPTDHP